MGKVARFFSKPGADNTDLLKCIKVYKSLGYETTHTRERNGLDEPYAIINGRRCYGIFGIQDYLTEKMLKLLARDLAPSHELVLVFL